jgi:hypothetical protein
MGKRVARFAAALIATVSFCISAQGASPTKIDIDTEFSTLLQELVHAAVLRSANSSQMDLAVERYQTRLAKTRHGGKDLSLNYFGFPRGFDASREGAKLVLGEDQEIKSLEAAETFRQLRTDQLQESIAEALLELSSAVGDADLSTGKSSLQHALLMLNNLCGADLSSRAVEAVTRWSSCVDLSSRKSNSSAETLFEWKSKTQQASNLGEQHDLITIELKHKLEGLCDQTKNKQASGKLVEGTVSAITMLGPGFGVPIAAQAVGASWGCANGGSEESKLLRELYYYRQLESRRKLFTDEAQLALLSYERALSTNNTSLLVCSEALLSDIVGPAALAQIVPNPILPHGRGAVPIPIVAQKQLPL